MRLLKAAAACRLLCHACLRPDKSHAARHRGLQVLPELCRGLRTSAVVAQKRAVIFDLGGVLIAKPGPIFKDFEVQKGLPADTILEVIRRTGQSGAWTRLNRGEITADEFDAEFSKECSQQLGYDVDTSGLLAYYEAHAAEPIPEMVDAIRCIRAEGLKTAILTNNWKHEGSVTSLFPVDKDLFDAVVESCRAGMAKPDPAIYQLCLDELKEKPEKTVFLDDLKENVKGARKMGIDSIQVDDTQQALSELAKTLGFPVHCFVEGTTAVRKGLELPTDSLRAYLNSINIGTSDDSALNVRQFKHGQSNPTYYVGYAGRDMVLRKKPPGKLLPSAHAVEREHQVMKALGGAGVPVPDLLALCEDDSIVGTPFYLMDLVKGRIYKEPSLPSMQPSERREVYSAMCDALCRIHSVDIKQAGLEGFGKQGKYVSRQIAVWSKQYKASETHDIPSMTKLMDWLPQHLPETEMVSVVHGDFRLDNLILHPNKSEVISVLDWELSTIGDPLSDLAYCCMPYYLSPKFPLLKGFHGLDVTELGIPTMEEFVTQYCQRRGIPPIKNLDFYLAFSFFRAAAILQGVYRRSQQGQASSKDAQKVGLLAEQMANLGWSFTKSPSSSNPSGTPPRSNGSAPSKRSFCTWTSHTRGYSTQAPGVLAISVSALSGRAQSMYKEVNEMITKYVYPVERELFAHQLSSNKWNPHPIIEQLKDRAKSEGLWNLFLPLEADPHTEYGAGLTNMEYAYMCELMGKSVFSPEVFNCSAPDTGNMEVLVKYGNQKQKDEWLKPLLDGTMRSCFAMSEPKIASSDATNIQSGIRRDGDELVLSGRKWWISGAMDPRCRVCIFMGKTDPTADAHKQQSMVLVPMDSPGLTVVRPLSVFGYEDPPAGHAELVFEDVRVPAENIILGEGRGFEIAQGRLGPGRIHHCMRLIGMAERCLELMVSRVQDRVAFGKPLAQQGTIQEAIAESRIEIEQARLLTLKAAHMMDTVGNKVAAPEIAMIKVVAPNMAQRVVDRAIQAFGGAGLSADWPLAYFFSWARILRLADGPDEVHRRAIARMELKKSLK
ncbi:acyl-CoA dehydrogenase family member 10-like isoform X2 [Acanthaster planci]|nr:acyl-CoA dehydrogenase family member 10-like isoform X2 [Acanthaster planci]